MKRAEELVKNVALFGLVSDQVLDRQAGSLPTRGAHQDTISRKSGRQCRIPVLCFTQLMGTAFGLNAEQIALKDSMTPVGAMFVQKGI